MQGKRMRKWRDLRKKKRKEGSQELQNGKGKKTKMLNRKESGWRKSSCSCHLAFVGPTNDLAQSDRSHWETQL